MYNKESDIYYKVYEQCICNTILLLSWKFEDL